MFTSASGRANRSNRRSTIVASAARSALIELLEPRQLLSTTYYVASTGGSDSNPGTSQSAPWASVAKVDATTFQPGDTIDFQYGSEFHGLLIASSSGTSGNPITYGAYGNASNGRPIFDGSDVIPSSAFTLVSGNTYSFPVSAVPNSGGNAFWVYANHAGMLAASASDNSSGGVQANTNSFYINGSTVYINTGGSNPATNGVVYTLGDRGAGQAANSSLIDSNTQNYVTFQNIEGRETAEVGGGNSLTGGISDGYVFRIQGGSNITLLNDDAEYGSKHNIGAINTTGFLAQNTTAEGAPEGVSGNNLPYGNATALVAYADNSTGQVNDTQSWINDSVTNYDGAQPGFYSHENESGDISNLTVTNLISNGSPVSITTEGAETINYTGGTITNNSLSFGDAPVGATRSPITVNGVTVTGSGNNYTQLLISGDTTVENCVVVHANQGGVQVLGPNNTIRFNTFSPWFAAGIVLQDNGNDGPTTGEKIYGNLITQSGTGIQTSSSGETFTADYDFFDSGSGSPSFSINGNNESLSTFQSQGYETHATVGNPSFVSATTGNYDLQSNSQAINTVPSSVVNPALTTDILGRGRPNANIYDAGAYEAQLVLHQPTVATAAAASPSTVTGTTTNLSVLGASPDGESTLNYNWTATSLPSGAAQPTYSINGTNASKNTTATFSKAGAYTFTVTITNGQYSTTSAVSVTVNQVSQGLSITPSQWYVSTGTTKQFTAAVTDQFGNPISGPTITYSIQSGGGSISSSGLFTPPTTAGSTTIIKASSGSVSATATANIVGPNQAPTVATAASSSANPVTGTTTNLSVLGDDDNGESNLTYTWSLVGTPPATVGFSANGTNASKNTTATFTANGNYNFLVTIVDQGGLSTTSSVTVTVNTFVPIVLDGTKDGRYGNPIAVQDVATNIGLNSSGNDVLGGATGNYSQLSAAYGVIDQPDGQFDLFIAGSLDLYNAHLDLLIDSVPGQGAANLNQLSNVGTWGSSPFSGTVLDSDFRPDHIITQTFGGGTSLDYYNFDSGTYANESINDPANGTATSSGSVPYFQERINNAQLNNVIQPSQAGSITTGIEYAFSLSGLGYTSSDYSAGDPIRVMALISYGSHYQYSNQWLAPLNPSASEASNNYFPIDLSNSSNFPGDQNLAVNVPAGYQGPTVTSPASVNPSPVTGSSATLSVAASDPGGASGLTYTWSTTGTPPGTVSYSANGTNGASTTTATFSANGTYNFLVTIKDAQGLTTTSTVTATVSGAGTGTNQAPTVANPAAASPTTVTGLTTSLSVLGADDGGESNLTYTWVTTGTPPAAVSFSANATNASKNTTATFAKAGSYSFTVTIKDAQGLTATSSVNVTVSQTATTVTISPTSVSVAASGTQQFTAAVKDQFGIAISSPSLTWSVPTGSGTISASGLYTAAASAGSATVKAVSGSASATASVTITATNAAPTVATAASASPNPVTGTTTALLVLGADDGGESNLVYTWATTGTPPAAVTFSANGTNASKNTTATFTKAGSYSFTVTIKDAQGLTVTSSTTVTVSQTATTVTLSPTSVSVAANGTQQFTATVKDQFATAITSPAVTWSVSAGSGTISSSGLYTAPASTGSATVKAVSGSASATASVTITATNAAPTVATAAKATPSPVTGTTTALSVLGADDGGEANLVYTWATTGTPPAAVTYSANGTNASKNTTATFTKAGSYSFTVTIKDSGGLTTTSSVTVTVNQTATTVVVSPSTVSIATGATQQYSAAVSDQFGAAIASPSVTWSVASGTGTISASGLYTAPAAAGSASVKATVGSASGTASVTVTASSGTSPVTVDGSLDSKYGSPIVVQSQATNIGNSIVGSGATAPYSQLSAGYAIIDEANNQFDLFIPGSLSLANAHFQLLLDTVPNAGVANLNSLNGTNPYGSQFPTIVLDNGFRPDHIFTFAYGAGTSVDYVNLDTGPSSHVAFTQPDPSSQLVTENVSGVPAYSERVNNAQVNSIIAANSGGSVTTGIEFSFNLSALGYTAANYNAGVPIGVMAMVTQGSNTVMSNQILAPYTPNQTYLNQDGGTYTYIGGNFDFSNNSKFAGNQFFQANPPAATVDGTLDARYGTADVIQTQATNFGNANYTGPYGNGASAPYSQLSAGYTVIDEAHNQLDLFIAGSLNLNNAHLDLLIDSVPGQGVANLSSLTNVGPYGTSFPTITLDAGFRPDQIFTFAYGGGTSVDYVNLDTGGSSHVAFTQPDPSQGPISESVAGVPSYQMAVNNAQQGNVIAAGAGGSITTGIEISFNLSALGYSPAYFAQGTPINLLAMITYGSHTVATNQILGGYVPNQTEINNNGGIYTFLSGGNFDFSNQTRFAGTQFFTAQTTPLYAVAAAAAAGFTPDTAYASGGSIAPTSASIDLAGDTNGTPMSVYQNERFGGNFTETFGGFVPNSAHTVTMAFSEIYFTAAGQRIFSVTANGQTLLNNFDVFAASGGQNKAINETFVVTADANGNIAFNFVASVDNAKVDAIEIF